MPKHKTLQKPKTLQLFDVAFVKMATNLNTELDNFEAMMAVKSGDDIIVENLHKELKEIKPRVEKITNKVITDFAIKVAYEDELSEKELAYHELEASL